MYAQYIIPAIAAIIVAIIEVRGQRDRKRTEERAKRRAQESRLSMDMMLTMSEMCNVLCIAVQGGKINGNVEEAQRDARKAREAYLSFLRDQAASQVTKV